MRKHALRTLGVSLLAALGLMAFAVAGAQAETAGKIIVKTSEHLGDGVPVIGEQLGEGTLKVPGLNIEIVCKKLKVVEGLIHSGLTGHGLGWVLYEECHTFSIKPGTLELIELLKECQILDSGAAKTIGHITAKANLLVLRHKGHAYVVAEPDQVDLKGTAAIAIVEFTKGIGCPLTLKQEIKGTTVFKVILADLNLEPEEVLVGLENNETIAALFPGNVLKYGANTSFITGKADLHLAGSHKGVVWGIL